MICWFLKRDILELIALLVAKSLVFSFAVGRGRLKFDGGELGCGMGKSAKILSFFNFDLIFHEKSQVLRAKLIFSNLSL